MVNPDDAYIDRNLLVQLVAALAVENGWRVGYAIDPQEPEWPVLLIDLPTGQISYHLPQADCLIAYGISPRPWDGHSTEEKRERIRRYIEDEEE